MSKSTKIIAALGVVAGLGVSALPLAANAAINVAGEAEVIVEVNPAIAMTISGNNKGTISVDGKTNGDVSIYTPTSSIDYRIDTYDTSDSKSIHDGSAADIMLSSAYTDILPNSKISGNDTNQFMSDVKVFTNNKYGYKLTVKGATAELVSRSDANDKISAATTVEAGTSAWGYRIGESTSVNAMKTSDVVIAALATKTTNGDETKVYYDVATSADINTGIYSDVLTYTATTFDSAVTKKADVKTGETADEWATGANTTLGE